VVCVVQMIEVIRKESMVTALDPMRLDFILTESPGHDGRGIFGWRSLGAAIWVLKRRQDNGTLYTRRHKMIFRWRVVFL
jgi:hypothetical protein